MIGVLRQAFPLQGPPAGPEQEGIEASGLGRSGKELTQQGQQGITRAQPAAELGDRLGPMPGLVPLQHYRTAGQVQATALELGAQGVIGAPIADLQSRQPAHQLRAQGEMTAKGAAAVVHEHQGHCAILISAVPLP